jgi:hypothetical protein
MKYFIFKAVNGNHIIVPESATMLEIEHGKPWLVTGYGRMRLTADVYETETLLQAFKYVQDQDKKAPVAA